MNLLNRFCDKDEVDGYFECTGKKNVAFYKKRGYDVINKIVIEYT